MNIEETNIITIFLFLSFYLIYTHMIRMERKGTESLLSDFNLLLLLGCI